MGSVRVRKWWPRLSLWRIASAVIAHPLIPHQARWRLLRLAGAEISPCRIDDRTRFMGKRNVSIGEGTYINSHVTFDGSAPVTIGRRVSIAEYVQIMTTTHHISDDPRFRLEGVFSFPVSIGDGCWLGQRVTILPGVSIGPGCVIAAGAVVTRDTEPNGLYGGVPAKRIRDLPVRGRQTA